MVKHDIIPAKEGEMTELICSNCLEAGKSVILRIDCNGGMARGIIQCLQCQHEFPFAMYGPYIQKVDIALPGAQSSRLDLSVPSDIKDDVREAERANYAQCYKACVAMCRRALELSLIEKDIEEKRLSQMLEEALNKKLLTQKTFDLATSIKGYGDIGVHRKDLLEPHEVNMVIYATVRMVNEIFK